MATRWSRRSSSCSRRGRFTWRPRRSGKRRVEWSPTRRDPPRTRSPLPGLGGTDVFNNLGNLADLMRNAGKIRETMEKATESLGQLQVEGTAGGGVVTAKANGRLELVSVRIDPKLLADGDAELLEDLVTAAVNQALTKAREAAARSISSLAGGLPIPGFPGFSGPPSGPGGGGA